MEGEREGGRLYIIFKYSYVEKQYNGTILLNNNNVTYYVIT